MKPHLDLKTSDSADARAANSPPSASDAILDTFGDDRRVGTVIGSAASSGHRRRGVDVEGVIGIDHQALRIQPLIDPGWGRSGIAYGPVHRRAGTALAVYLVNGHNLSRSFRLESFMRQVWRWIDGPKAQPAWRQVLNWTLRHRPRESMIRKLRRWWRHRPSAAPHEEIWDNLLVGFLAAEVPSESPGRGNTFLVRAARDLDNGELCVSTGGRVLPAFKSFQNVPVLYVIVLRERGAIYYAAGPPGAYGLGSHPHMRPLGIDPFDESPKLYPGVHQAVLGEIGFGIDTRVFAVKTDHLAVFEGPFGAAHLADDLTGNGELGHAFVGGPWRVTGAIQRSPHGACGSGRALLGGEPPVGLTHALLAPGSPKGNSGILLRARGEEHLRLIVNRDEARIIAARSGNEEVLAEAPLPDDLVADNPWSLQVLDDGASIGAYLNGHPLFNGRVDQSWGGHHKDVGFVVSGDWTLGSFEAHPREVPIPISLNLDKPWTEVGSRIIASDSFAGTSGELAGRATDVGQQRWNRVLGHGVLEVTGSGAARIKASPAEPNPGRTVYAIDWTDPRLADLEVEVTPPGTARYQGHKCRAGFCFWQDAGTYILINVWLDDSMSTSSISSFFCVNGFEDIFEAVWTCMGEKRARWGVPLKLRIVCDGGRYHVRVNDEPVLYRALSDVYPTWDIMSIRKVGLAATWEWGNDTGSEFRSFVARGH